MEAAASVEAAAEARSAACGESHRIAAVVETAERAGAQTGSRTTKGPGMSEPCAFATEAVANDKFPAVGVVRVIAVG
jgi:hypothetical protein